MNRVPQSCHASKRLANPALATLRIHPVIRKYFQEFTPAISLGVIGFLGLAMAWLSSGQKSSQYLIIAAPNASLSETVNYVRAAEGSLRAVTALSNIVIADATSANFPNAVRKAGAWVAIPRPPISGCNEASSSEVSR